MSADIPDLILDAVLYTLEYCWVVMGVYPRESFSKVVFYGMHVDHTRHMGVQQYLDGLRSQLNQLISRKRLARVFFDFETDAQSVVSLGVSFGEFFLEDGRGIGWKVIGAPSKRDSWVTVVASLKTWFLQTRLSLDQLSVKAVDFSVRISSVPDDELILDEHWGLDSRFDPTKIINRETKTLSFDKIPDLHVDLGDDGKLKLHSYIVNKEK